jgi:hypothetical protein
MNRIILIGNGFDLAHGLKTSYRDFMNNYWRDFVKNIPDKLFGIHEDEFTKFEKINGPESSYKAYLATSYGNEKEYRYLDIFEQGIIPDFCKALAEIISYSDLKQLIDEVNQASDLQFDISFKNKFFGHLSETLTLNSWLDIENEYYTLLKDFLKESRRYAKLWPTVKDLNGEFCEVKKELEKYLTKVCKQEIKANEHIDGNIKWPIKPGHIARSKAKREMLLKEIYGAQLLMANTPELLLKRFIKEGHKPLERITIQKTLFLNFNYTNTAEKLYANPNDRIINIHGKLNSKTEPIIFGYGDELDEEYNVIERTQNNDFLENIKSIRYHYTPDYRHLLDFLEDAPYQVCTMGHSCGNSDRTLLNTIFEHENCVSVKPFFYQWWNKNTQEKEDNHTEIVMNISRNFNDKQKMRDIVVNRKYCLPLVPCNNESKRL